MTRPDRSSRWTHPHRRSRPALALGVGILLLALPATAPAHETQKVNRFRLTIGWGDEPVFSGLRNSVEVDVSDTAGAPVTDAEGSLSAEVSFGDGRIVLPLLPSGQHPGRYRAWLVPTRSGTYTFHITGTMKGQTTDASSTCSASTCDGVTDISNAQSPAKDPSAGQLGERVDRARPRADRAVEAAAAAKNVSIAAIVVASLALVAAFGFGVRKGRKDV